MNGRRRGDTPPEPFDALDTGRDHITSPYMKNGDRDHSAKNRIATAAAPTSSIRKDDDQ